ncbi:PREDICTED: 4-hydroxybutyrate coenzyme A transferase-like [Priapulus caudatus]|uniref:4-hydroxybutyrate coenzyme A transferase-like n=1 Tax=Priapulus caudatus TaxID=37621 RepID=A0ABM1EP81_PRICU|nr:PREDICTED: 4-hydroxybutyrate coenzyme A transferase-like [Priapulus caudatus]
MGSYDGAEVCELVGLFMLNNLCDKYGKDNVGLYRDDGLAIFKNTTASQAERIKKDITKHFKKHGNCIKMAARLFNVSRLNLLKKFSKSNEKQLNDFYTYSSEPFHPLPNKVPTWRTAEEATAVIKSYDRVWVHGSSMTPTPLINAMAEHGRNSGLKKVEVMHILTEGPMEITKPEFEGIFRVNALFLDKNTRGVVNEGRADYVPIFLSEIPLLFERGIVNIDVALIQVSPPDEHGFCTLGSAVECTRAAIINAKYIIGLVNSKVPRTFGHSGIHMSHIDVMVAEEMDLPSNKLKEFSDIEKMIAMHIAGNLVADGATLQMGIGTIPQAVCEQLRHHRDLGIHTEMFGDKVVDLMELGCITNARKSFAQGKSVVSFVVGSRRVYDFLDNNLFVLMYDVRTCNNIRIICQNTKMTAINSAIEIDLTGQVVADSIGTEMYSGVGGQIDFIRGAALALDALGKPIIAMPSRTKDASPKIVPQIKLGAGVVTTRAHVHYIVTEYGIAQLFGKNLRQRAYELINIAHPDDREMLEHAAFKRLKCMPSP